MLDVTSHRSTTLKRLKPCIEYIHICTSIYIISITILRREVDGLKCIILYENKAHSYYMQDRKWTLSTINSTSLDRHYHWINSLFEMHVDLMWISGLTIWPKWTADSNSSPRSSFINIHWFVFISRPDHMQNNTRHWGIFVYQLL